MTAKTQTKYFVVPAPGHYGDRAQVYSSHRSFAAARKAAGSGAVIRQGSHRKGDLWLRVYEETYPIAESAGAIDISANKYSIRHTQVGELEGEVA